MESIHCINCGGYITNTRRIEYRSRLATPRPAPLRYAPCACAKPTLYMPVFHTSARRMLAYCDAPSAAE